MCWAPTRIRRQAPQSRQDKASAARLTRLGQRSRIQRPMGSGGYARLHISGRYDPPARGNREIVRTAFRLYGSGTAVSGSRMNPKHSQGVSLKIIARELNRSQTDKQIARMYRARHSIHSIATTLGLPLSTIRRSLERSGLDKHDMISALADRPVIDRDTGESWPSVSSAAAALGRSYKAVWFHLRGASVKCAGRRLRFGAKARRRRRV